MKKLLLAAGFIGAVLQANAQDCAAVTTLNEDFNDFTVSQTAAFPQNCWSAIAGGQMGPWVYTTAASSTDTFATFYSFFSPNVAAYLVSPEVSTFDGNHQLSFSSWKVAQGGQIPEGTVTIQPGTLTDAADATTFVAFGEPITIEDGDVQNIENIVLPASTTAKYIALKVIATEVHNAVGIDNFVWNEVPAPACEAVATINEDFSEFVTGVQLPFNCWSSIVTSSMIYTGNTGGSITYYAAMTPAVPSYLVSPEVSTFDGNHQLTFDAYKSTSNTVTVQTGYLTNAADATTFVAVGEAISLGSEATTYTVSYPALQTNAYIAFQYTGGSVHQAAITDNVVWAEVPAEECAAVSTLNEDFSTFTPSTNALSQNCWSSVSTSTLVYVIAGGGDTKVQFYSGSAANEPGYLVSPAINSFDGEHTLTFDAASGTAVSLQPGYFTDATDAATFVAVGDAITLTATSATYTVNNFPELTGTAYIAFQFIASGAHNTATVDNVKWDTTASTGIVNAKAFTLYPNPAKGSVNLVNNADANGTVNVYSLTGAQVYSAKIGAGEQSLNLSGLQGGMYIVQVQAGNAVTTQKLILE